MSNIVLDAPPSDNTVKVRMVDTTTVMVLHAKTFIEPMMPGHETMSATDVAFLIENERLGKKALFDLGTRKDFWNLPPTIRKRFDHLAAGMRIPKDVKDILSEKNIPLESINDIIWSHAHWDHTGDTTLFPQTTNLVHGPEVSTSKPFYPTNPKSPIPSAQFENRHNNEISYLPSGLTIGGFPAHDFYGDGSFYLLSTPGHAKGHLCALARTTKDTFILMGGDVCHFPGAMRPNEGYPMPDPIPADVLDKTPDFPVPCPALYFLDNHPQFQNQPSDSKPRKSRNTTPFYALSTAPHTVYDTPSPAVAQETVNTLIRNFDSNPKVFVMLAHDPALVEYLPTLNEQPEADLNAWFERGWKERCYWGWLNLVSRRGGNGRKPIVEGWWVGERRFGSARELLDVVDGEMGVRSGVDTGGGKL